MDRLTKEKRSWNMARVTGKNTKPEIFVRSALHKTGYRFRLHVRKLPGAPDIVLTRHKAVIFVHGCFWHGHDGCKGGSIPKTRTGFWQNKICENRSRDRRQLAELQENGWRTGVVWECALRNNTKIKCTLSRLGEWIRSGLGNIELP